MSQSKGVDKVFLVTVLILVFFGFVVFLSASMGILAKDTAKFSSVAFKQTFFGLILGLISCFVFSKIDYRALKKFSFYIFLASVLVSILVFIPHIGISLNGAKRWISILGISFQPAEFLKIGFVLYWAAWLTYAKDKVRDFKYGLLPFLILLAVTGGLILAQPDTDSFIILFLSGLAMYIVAGGRFKHMIVLFLIGVIGLTFLAYTRPYVMSRLTTFVRPSENSLSSSYQLQQAQIAIGSGKMFGRGLGQSIQKFKFLPESVSDAVFAVAGEELGFVGCTFIILLFLFFVFRSFRIALQAQDLFGGLLVVGIVIIIMSQSFINIASMVGVMPLSGVPLAFFSQGGTALFAVLAEVGIILNISRFKKIQ
jgi:cell division protein FtsW